MSRVVAGAVGWCSEAMRCDAGRGTEARGGLRHEFAEGRFSQSEEDWGRLAVRLQGTEPRGDGKIG